MVEHGRECDPDTGRRLAAARSEGTHPSAPVAIGTDAAQGRKSRTGEAVGSERGKNGLTR